MSVFVMRKKKKVQTCQPNSIPNPISCNVRPTRRVHLIPHCDREVERQQNECGEEEEEEDEETERLEQKNDMGRREGGE